jgi:hypothetical protein
LRFRLKINIKKFSFSDNRRGHNENCINSFCWLKKESDHVLTIDSKNSFRSINMSDYVALNFSTDNFVTVSSNDINKENINKFEINKKNDQNLQIDERMKERAMNNYGVQEFLNNAELIENENKNQFDVVYLWRWLDCIQFSYSFLKSHNFKSKFYLLNYIKYRINHVKKLKSLMVFVQLYTQASVNIEIRF